jgi:hypothetical protein
MLPVNWGSKFYLTSFKKAAMAKQKKLNPDFGVTSIKSLFQI